MTAAYTVLQVDNGSVVRDLVDGVNYYLSRAGWGPQVSGLRVSPLGGRGPWLDVMESISVYVIGSTGAVALANLANLVADLVQAQRWQRGDDVLPVLLKVQPQGSLLSNPLQTVIMGGGDDPLNLLKLPLTFNDLLMVFEVGPVDIRFLRPGVFLGDLESSTTSAAFSHPSVKYCSFLSSAGLYSPVAVTITGFTGSVDGVGNGVGSDVYLIMSNDRNKIEVGEAELCTANVPVGGTFGASGDGAASGGQIRRLTPGGVGVYELVKGVSLPGTRMNRYVILATVRNNSGVVDYVTWAAVGNGISWNMVGCAPQVVPAGSVKPQVVRYDPVVFDGLVTEVRLFFSPSATGGTGDRLDVDVFVIVQVDEVSRVIAVRGVNRQVTLAGSLVVDDRSLTRPTPQVVETASGVGDIVLGYEGDVMLSSVGSELAVCLIGTTDSQWRIVNGTVGAGTAVSSTVSAVRRPAYLIPQ